MTSGALRTYLSRKKNKDHTPETIVNMHHTIISTAGSHSRRALIPLAAALFGAVLLASCAGRGGADTGGVESAAETPAAPVHRLALPQPPVALADPGEQAAYVAEHYWDRFNFADTTWIADTAALEQAYANYLSLLPMLPAARASAVQRTLIDSAARSSAMLDRFTEMSEHYLYDPNSPMRSEELYIPVLEALIALPGLDDVYKIRPRAQLAMALKNRPGMVAADFAYTKADGSVSRLSALRDDYTVLFFYNPDCPDCKRTKEYIASSEVFSSLQTSGKLAVLAVYTDEDLALWREHLPEMPRGWTVGYDRGRRISETELYDLRAIPTLYLLDARKRVILKDAPVERIEAWLTNE